MHWLKQNWFQLGILLTVFCIGTSIFYYLVVFLPQTSNQNFEQKEESLNAKGMEKSDAIRNDIISGYRATCSEYEKGNKESIDGQTKAIISMCNKERSPFECARKGISTIDSSIIGESYIRECVSNLIRKYGTEGSY